MKKLTIILGLILLGSGTAVAQEAASPPGGLEKPQAVSLWNENFRNDDYKRALRFGRWIWRSMPRSFEFWPGYELEQHMGRFVTIYTTLAEQAEDPSIKSAYVDSVNLTYGKVFNEMKEDEYDVFDWRVDYGRFFQNFGDVIENSLPKAAEQYTLAMERDRQRLIDEGEGYYVRAIVLSKINEGDEDAALQMMDELESEVNQQVADWFDQQREQLFDTPEERLEFLNKQLSEDPENVELLREIRSIHRRQDNTQEIARINQKLYELNPSYENTMALAEAAVGNAENERALELLSEAMEKAPDDATRSDIALQIADIHYNQDNLQQSRRFARQAAELDPSNGDPYMRIGAIYARAVSNCTSGRETNRDDRAVYWLVIDYYQRAKQTEPSLASQADAQIDRYMSVAPQSTDVFMRSAWEEGATLQINGDLNECYSWINESTTIRLYK
ncbi:MAG: hypothetical protein U5K31_08675 [Balneolaceae bacterium]|nr:hypothetical protein [Balneolaceae bacterium]